MSQTVQETTSRIEVVKEGSEWSVRENGRTLIRFFGKPGAVDLGCTLAKTRAPSEIVIRTRDATGASNARSGFGRILVHGDVAVDHVHDRGGEPRGDLRAPLSIDGRSARVGPGGGWHPTRATPA